VTLLCSDVFSPPVSVSHTREVAPALAAGCVVILKPAEQVRGQPRVREGALPCCLSGLWADPSVGPQRRTPCLPLPHFLQTPLSALYLASLTREAGFPPGVVQSEPAVYVYVGCRCRRVERAPRRCRSCQASAPLLGAPSVRHPGVHKVSAARGRLAAVLLALHLHHPPPPVPR